jgi:hypothetical protein
VKISGQNHNLMKQFTLNSLALAICVFLFVGCSSVKPTPKQSSAVVAPSAQKQPCAPYESLMKRFVNGWLAGKAPPPDYTEEDKTGVAACAGIAFYASMTGLLIAQAVH